MTRRARLGMPQESNLDFSFSGLKTALLYTIRKCDQPLSDMKKADLAASFLQAVVQALVRKCKFALKATGHKRLAVGGGVAVNGLLRSKLGELAATLGVELVLAPLPWCTDNAAMAAVSVEYLRQGKISPPDLDAMPY